MTDPSFSLCSQYCLARFRTPDFCRAEPKLDELSATRATRSYPNLAEFFALVPTFRILISRPFECLKSVNSDLFLRTNNILVEGPTAHRYTFFTPFILELQFFNLFVGKSHHIMRQHSAVLDQFLDFYFSKEYVQVHG